MSSIQASHTIHVSFEAIQYNITAQASVGGTVSPTQLTMTIEDEQTFTATPDENYSVHQWRLDGAVVQNGGNQFAFSAPSDDYMVEVSFLVPDYDRDGMPDWWEDQYGGDLQPEADDDADEIPNIVEFQEGLDPTVPNHELEYLVLRRGWNLVAIPTVPTRQTFGSLFGDKILGIVWAWDPGDQSYRGADEDDIDPKRGVWVYAVQICGIALE